MKLTEREREIIYFALSRELDDTTNTQEEFNRLDNLRSRFKPKKMRGFWKLK